MLKMVLLVVVEVTVVNLVLEVVLVLAELVATVQVLTVVLVLVMAQVEDHVVAVEQGQEYQVLEHKEFFTF
jgi:hypothetical protein